MSTLAPAAPGRIGEAIQPAVLLRYLQELQVWVTERREELDQLDAAIQELPPPSPQNPTAPNPRALTTDMMLSMTLWQAVKARLELLLATWDSGRVGEQERQKMSVLIWGRLDTSVGRTASNTQLAGMNMSLPEATRLSDALAGQLATRLGRTPSSDALASRLRQLKAEMERLRDQVKLEPADTIASSQHKLDQLVARVSDLEGRNSRGGDIGGMIGPLEIDAAKFERDMIVSGAERRKAKAKADAVREQLEDLRVKEEAMHALVAQAVSLVSPAPKYAVPDVDALGPLPADAAGLDAYSQRLTQVNKALQVVQTAYSKAVNEHAELAARLDAAKTKASALGLSDPAMEEVAATATRLLAQSPTPMTVARSLVDAYANHVQLARQEATR